ncbi:response regulator [Pleionea sp. CnH1-48]|uniref:response regulator n=1 Tax=Pleionea sp. CnH1-48 TaxID=2954494 RepID=UPI002097A0B4|nr:response regulator [Pleionea sp. CnH1-48]MCO7223309.1 response regulator [Pleionea sp. CnH1-48]
MSHTILVVEDEVDIASIVISYLQAAGYSTEHFSEGSGVVEWVKEHSPSLILLDLMLPGQDGMDICRAIRTFSDVPIIITTAKVEEIDRLIGLESGADDYVCKPYSPRELTARVKANLRRTDRQVSTSNQLVLNQDNRVSYQANSVELTTVEYNLLKLLYSQPNRIFSRDQIIRSVYVDYREVSDRTVDSHIRNLRKKLKGLELDNELVRSIYGAGYKFEPIDL